MNIRIVEWISMSALDSSDTQEESDHKENIVNCVQFPSSEYNFEPFLFSIRFFLQVRLYDYESRYSFHLWDAIAFFDQLEVFSHRSTVEERFFRDTVRGIVFKFVKGHLNEMWKPFPGEIALLDKNISFVPSSYEEKRCNFWKLQGLLDYAWVS